MVKSKTSINIHAKLAELIPPGGVVIEIGAHIGIDTVKLRDRLKPSVLYAFEPDPRNYEKIEQLIEQLDLENVELCDVFVGNTVGEIPVWWSYGTTPNGREHTDSNSIMKPKNNAPWVKFRKGTKVCVTLDSVHFLKGVKVDLIWMDVQGAELLVFEGAQETLKRTTYLYTECQEGRYHGQPGIEGILEALPGWEVVIKNGDNVLLRNSQC